MKSPCILLWIWYTEHIVAKTTVFLEEFGVYYRGMIRERAERSADRGVCGILCKR